MIITESAISQFRKMIQSRYPNIEYPRIEIAAGGCQGFEKKFSFDIIREDDIIVKHDDVNIVVDKTTYDMLQMATIDYKIDISGSNFTIDIPHALSTCGCGISFSL